ncbi:MAG: TetR/AcrR family transcriptional regulator [Thermoguttaceae bacterium]|jgi:AcrR family transcriptional regulator
MADAKLQSQVRREQIAEVALGLVASEGLKRLSIAAVARRVGLVPSGIYRHFRSKDEVLDAVLDLLEKKLAGIVEAARADSAGALGRLRSLLMRHVRFIREGRAFPRIIFSDDMTGHLDRKARVRQILSGYLDQVEQMVREGHEEGSIRREIVPASAALMFLGTVMPAAVLWHLTDGGFDVTQHAARAWELFAAALRSPQ